MFHVHQRDISTVMRMLLTDSHLVPEAQRRKKKEKLIFISALNRRDRSRRQQFRKLPKITCPAAGKKV
jgi:hypothetical protein